MIKAGALLLLTVLVTALGVAFAGFVLAAVTPTPMPSQGGQPNQWSCEDRQPPAPVGADCAVTGWETAIPTPAPTVTVTSAPAAAYDDTSLKATVADNFGAVRYVVLFGFGLILLCLGVLVWSPWS